MKRLAAEHDAIRPMVLVARVAIVRVEPQTIVVVFDREQVRVTVRVHVCETHHSITGGKAGQAQGHSPEFYVVEQVGPRVYLTK